MLAEYSLNSDQHPEILPFASMDMPLSKDDIRAILGRHPGSKAELARRSGGRSLSAVSTFLKHGTSAPMMEQARILCSELLAKEEAPSARQIVEGLRKGDPEVKPIIEKLLDKGSTGGE